MVEGHLIRGSTAAFLSCRVEEDELCAFTLFHAPEEAVSCSYCCRAHMAGDDAASKGFY